MLPSMLCLVDAQYERGGGREGFRDRGRLGAAGFGSGPVKGLYFVEHTVYFLTYVR